MQSKTPRPSYSLDIQADSTKNQMHAAIRDKDHTQVRKLVKLYNFLSHEECSVKGYYWNTLHYSSHFHSDRILEYFLKKTYQLYPDAFVQIVNEKTCEGWTPLMIACIYGAQKCLELLLKCGGVKINEKDAKGKTAIELGTFYGRSECAKILNAAKDKLGKGDQTQHTNINEEFLSDFRDDDATPNTPKKIVSCHEPSIEDRDEFSTLLKHGERLPCLICLSNKGYIKYTTCCGQPMHSLCKNDRIKGCPNCARISWDLTSEIEHPERAYIMADF